MKRIILTIILLVCGFSTFAQSAPQNLVSYDIDEMSAVLSWDGSQNAFQWIVEYGVALGEETETVTTTDTMIQIFSLVEGTHYTWRVRMVNLDGDTGVWSSTESFYTLGFSSSCAEINEAVISNIDDNGITLQWTSGTDNDSWEAVCDEIGTDPSNTGVRHYTSNMETTFPSLLPAHLYQFSVRSHCDATVSRWKYLFARYLTSQSIFSMPISSDLSDTATTNHIGFISSPDNPWVTGTAENCGTGSGTALYVSDNNGLSNIYSPDKPAISYAYIDFLVPEDAVSFYIDFQYKSSVVSSTDGMKVYLLSNGSSLTIDSLPNQAFRVGSLLYNNTNNEWTSEHIELPVEYAGSPRRLAFVWTNSDTTLTAATPMAVDNIYITARYCAIPDSLRAESVTYNSAVLAWNMTSNQQSYNLQMKRAADTVWNDYTGVTNNLYIDTLQSNTAYCFRVQADCISEESFYSEIDTFLTHAVILPPDSIEFTAEANSADFSWQNQSDALYWITAYRENSFYSPWHYDTTETSLLHIDSLMPNTEYAFRVRAVSHDYDTSAWSPEVVFTTECLPVNAYPYMVNGTTDYNSVSSYVNLPTCWQGMTDTLFSPVFNMYELNAPTIGFDAQFNTGVSIDVSLDGGETFSPLDNIASSTAFTHKQYNVPQCALEENVMFRFTFVPIHDATTIIRLRNFSVTNLCAAPSAVNVDSVSVNMAEVSWSSTYNTNAWNLKLYNESDSLLREINTSYNHYYFFTLDSASIYTLSIHSLCDGTLSEDSTLTTIITSGERPACDVPQNFHAEWYQTKGDETIMAQWDAGESNIWEVAYKERWAMEWNYQTVTINPVFTIRNLDLGDEYVIKVRSICSVIDTSAFTEEDTVYVGTSSIEDVSGNAYIDIYPNPAEDYFNISCGIEGVTLVTLQNIKGETLRQWTYLPEQISTSSLPPSVYTITIYTADKKFTRKVIVK